METTQFIALPAIGAAEKIRLLVYIGAQAGKVAHAPLSSLMKAGLTLEQGAGFRHYADGTLIQWGQGSGVDPLVTFPRSFSKICWHVSLTNHDLPQADRLVVRSASHLTLSSFVAQGRFVDFSGGGGSADTPFSWMAFGE